MKRTKQLRLLVLGLALALTLAVAGPAVAEPPSWSSGWVTGGLEQLSRWWTAVWGTPAGTIRAASEVTPNIDPNGVAQPPGEPADPLLVEDGEPGNENEVLPHIDPNG